MLVFIFLTLKKFASGNFLLIWFTDLSNMNEMKYSKFWLYERRFINLYCIWTCIIYLIIHYFWCSVAFSWYLYVKSTGYPYLERNNSCQEVQFTLGRDSWWRENRKYTSGVVFYVHILLTNYHISYTKQINSLVLFLLMCVRDMLCCLIIDRCIHMITVNYK